MRRWSEEAAWGSTGHPSQRCWPAAGRSWASCGPPSIAGGHAGATQSRLTALATKASTAYESLLRFGYYLSIRDFVSALPKTDNMQAVSLTRNDHSGRGDRSDPVGCRDDLSHREGLSG